MSGIDELVKSLEALPDSARQELATRLAGHNLAEMQAAAVENLKKMRAAKISAMRADRNGNPEFRLVEGVLSRMGIAIDDVSDVRTLDKLFAAAGSKATIENRMMAKSALFHLKLIDA